MCLQSIKFAGERSAGHRSHTNLAALALRPASKGRRISEDTQPLTGYLTLPDHAMRSGPREVGQAGSLTSLGQIFCLFTLPRACTASSRNEAWWGSGAAKGCGKRAAPGAACCKLHLVLLPTRLTACWLDSCRSPARIANWQSRLCAAPTRILQQSCLRAQPSAVPAPQIIYHNPKDTHIAVCTVGGICPGVNDVLRSLVHKVGLAAPPLSTCCFMHVLEHDMSAGVPSVRASRQSVSNPPGRRANHECAQELPWLLGRPPLAAQVLDYGVPESNILGVRYGFRGFYDKEHKPVVLTRR